MLRYLSSLGVHRRLYLRGAPLIRDVHLLPSFVCGLYVTCSAPLQLASLVSTLRLYQYQKILVKYYI